MTKIFTDMCGKKQKRLCLTSPNTIIQQRRDRLSDSVMRKRLHWLRHWPGQGVFYADRLYARESSLPTHPRVFILQAHRVSFCFAE